MDVAAISVISAVSLLSIIPERRRISHGGDRMLKSVVAVLLAISTLAALGSTLANAEANASNDPTRIGNTKAQETTSDQPPTTPLADNGEEQSPVAEFGGSPGSNVCLEENDSRPTRRYIADIELLALRTHFSEDPLGKLGEHYELSERVTIGVEKPNGIGGRIRYWSYDRTMPNLQGGSDLGADFSVTDFEGTTHICSQSFDLLLAGGIRFADIRLDTDSGHVRSNQMPGATIALDLRGFICHTESLALEWHSISGARLSILGCDWRSDNGLIAETRDDNVTAMEIYGGFECSHYSCGHEYNARLTFEAQNWRSDALGENTGIDSIGFVGPGLNLGMKY
jgi:hypothetical protein